MKYVRAEDGVILLTRRAVLLTTAWAALHGLWSVRAILGRSAGLPSRTPPVTRQTEKWKCRSTSFGDKQSYDTRRRSVAGIRVPIGCQPVRSEKHTGPASDHSYSGCSSLLSIGSRSKVGDSVAQSGQDEKYRSPVMARFKRSGRLTLWRQIAPLPHRPLEASPLGGNGNLLRSRSAGWATRGRTPVVRALTA
jgi:hypothetical protein